MLVAVDPQVVVEILVKSQIVVSHKVVMVGQELVVEEVELEVPLPLLEYLVRWLQELVEVAVVVLLVIPTKHPLKMDNQMVAMMVHKI
tara:strand:- start:186 stop:449 length:264 start_codon:yes stop_codon:yes gene_type:complete